MIDEGRTLEVLRSLVVTLLESQTSRTADLFITLAIGLRIGVQHPEGARALAAEIEALIALHDEPLLPDLTGEAIEVKIREFADVVGSTVEGDYPRA